MSSDQRSAVSDQRSAISGQRSAVSGQPSAGVKAVLRRGAPAPAGQAAPAPSLAGPGGLRLDVERREVTVGETPLDFSRLEFDLLHTLLAHAGRVLTREQVLEQVWGYDYLGDTRAVDSVVKRLRAKLRAADPRADCVAAVRGVGYKLKGDDDEE